MSDPAAIPEPPRRAAAPLHSGEAELEALGVVCERLQGFGADLSVEYVDGWLTALACIARAVPREEWLPLLADDSFDRAYADPDDAAPALAALDARLRVLASQLAPEELFADPDALRLAPVMIQWDDASRAEAVVAGELDADGAAYGLRTGVQWAEGFRDAVGALGADWPDPADDDGGAALAVLRIMALLLSEEDLATYAAEAFQGRPPSRDELIDEACWSVQDLRLHLLERAVHTPPRRVEPKVGRNDPCPCGSGKKFKKCHGA